MPICVHFKQSDLANEFLGIVCHGRRCSVQI